MKKWIIIAMAAISVILGLVIEPFTSDVYMQNLIDFSMDSDYNFYFINYTDKGYRLAKADSKGNIQFSQILEQPEDENQVMVYKQIEVSKSGDIFLLYEQREISLDAGIVKDQGILNEKIVEYSSEGDYVKEITSVDFSQKSPLPKSEYIYKFQILGDEMATIICKNDYTYDVLTTNVRENNKPESQQVFNINEGLQTDGDVDWLNDIVVAPNGQVLYSTKRGELYLMDSEHEFKNITSIFNSDYVSAFNFSVDKNNNIFFTEVLSGNYYKLNLQTMTLTVLYDEDSIVNSKKQVKLNDTTYVRAFENGTYYASLKYKTGDGFVVFGNNETIINNISESYSIYRIAKIVLISSLVFAVAFTVYLLVNKLRDRFPLKRKIILLFLPFYILSMFGLICLVANIVSSNRSDYLNSEQYSTLKIIVDNLDKDTFKDTDPISGYMDDGYKTLSEQLTKGFEEAISKVEKPSQFVRTYKMKDNKIYTFIGNEYVELFSKEGLQSQLKLNTFNIPIDYMENNELTDTFYKVWNDFVANKDTEKDSYVVIDNYGEWLSIFEPIRSSDGELIGMIQGSIDKGENQDKLYIATLLFLICTFTLVSVIIFLLFFFILRFSFKPLKTITAGIDDLSKGKWNTRLLVKSKDELSDIANAFNLMIDRMNQYISNLVLLNKEYIKFVPMELINLLGKNRITDIKLDDKNNIELNIVSVSFERKFLSDYESLSESDYFKMMNDKFDLLFKVVENNHGIIQTFDGMGMVVLFPNSAEDAIVASMQFKEVFVKEKFKDSMRIILSSGNAIVGIIGNKKRNSITVVSDEVIEMEYLRKNIDNICVQHFALEPIINKINEKEKSSRYGYRFIGQIKHVIKNRPIKMYEFIDMTSLYEKNLYLSTKPLFEQAVKTYIKGDFAKARNLFANVLRINEEDKMAMEYLVLCDKNSDKKQKDWKGYMFE